MKLSKNWFFTSSRVTSRQLAENLLLDGWMDGWMDGWVLKADKCLLRELKSLIEELKNDQQGTVQLCVCEISPFGYLWSSL